MGQVSTAYSQARRAKMGYRCVKDIYNYCSGEPKSGKCRLNPATCGKHQSLKEHLESNKKAKQEVSDGS